MKHSARQFWNAFLVCACLFCGMGAVMKVVNNLQDLGNVRLGSPSNGQALVWDSTAGKWTNGSASGGSGYVASSNGEATNLTVTAAPGDIGFTYTSAAGVAKVTLDANGNAGFAGTASFTGQLDAYANTSFQGTNAFVGPINSSGNNTWTGTNTVTPNLLVFSDGSRPSLRLVASTNQIVFVPAITNNYVDSGFATNNGDWNNGKAYPLTRLTIPALPAGSTNSRVLIDYQLGWTNINSAAILHFYAGPNTNWIGSANTSGNTTSPFLSIQSTSLNEVLQFYGSRTNQFIRLIANTSNQPLLHNQLRNYFDGSTNWDFYIAIQSPHSLASGNVQTNTIWYPVSVHYMDR